MTTVDDGGFPIRRAIVGFVLLVAFVLAVLLLVRPAIFSLAPPRDDRAVAVGTLTDLQGGFRAIDVVLSRSYGWDGEIDAGDRRVQLRVIVGAVAGPPTAVSAASPLAEDCPVEIAADRLVDCEGRQWTFAGLPIDPADPRLDRFPVTVDEGAVFVDFTRTIDGDGG